MENIIERIALVRNNHHYVSKRDYEKVDNVLCQIYDKVKENSSLPDVFFLKEVALSPEELKKIFEELGLNVSLYCMNPGALFGCWYKVRLL